MQILKRNGKFVEFDLEKIVQAITKSMTESKEGVDIDLAWDIAYEIEDEFEESQAIPSVESVQDRVEELLTIYDRFDASKAYIIYRSNRDQQRVKGWELDGFQKDIYENKYRHNNETFSEFLERVSGGDEAVEKAIREKEFIPAGRILAGRGLASEGGKITLSNCYVLPKVEDNIESIFDTAKYMARTFSYGGGVGLNISNLRPLGAKVNNAAKTTTGAISFMDLYSMVTGLIGQKGRRGALMLNMDVSHPDIEDFINVKKDLSRVNFANISVNLDDDFMMALSQKEHYNQNFLVKSTGESINKKVDPESLFYLIAKNNWEMAEPGVLYQNRINEWHLMSEYADFEFAGVNPCAEEPLPPFGSCNLSSINLGVLVVDPFTEKARFNYDRFRELVRSGVVYLNGVLDENSQMHPIEEQKEVSKEWRQIGLGIMGLADMFIKLGVRYGSDQSIDIIEDIGHVMINEALKQSALLAKEHGPFPRYNKEETLRSPFLKANADKETLELIKLYGLRNSQLLTIPPTGSTSTIIGASNGIEPLFQISYTRKTESLFGEEAFYQIFAPIVKEYMDKYEIYSEKDLPEHFVTTSNLDYKERVRVQSAWQKYIDASISSTVNVPYEFTIEEIEDLYKYAWGMGLKGITIFRDGCFREGVLTTSTTKNTKPKEENYQDSENLESFENSECST